MANEPANPILSTPRAPQVIVDVSTYTAHTAHTTHTVGVVGTGYVGVVTAAALAELGHRVIGYDVNADRVATLRRGVAPFVEPQLNELLARNADRVHFTTVASELYARATIVFICVDTPPTQSGDADLSRTWAALDAIPEAWSGVLAMKSTVPTGTGSRIEARLRKRSGGTISYVSNPEFLREGSAVADVLAPDRVVVGSTDVVAAEQVAALWAPVCDSILYCDVASAELIKLASNAFLATKISFVNEIANVCELVGADVSVVSHGMGLDARIGPAFLQAGIGYGGSCFPKDVVALKQLAGNAGYHFQLLTGVVEVNSMQRRRLIATLMSHLGPLRGRRIALLGLAFKPNTDDVRESPALTIAARLVAEGAYVVAHDPVAIENARPHLPTEVATVTSFYDALANSDAALIVTDWPEYLELLDPQVSATMATPLLIDGRNLLDPVVAARCGYTWVGVGRPPQSPSFDCELALVGT
jgi:UDPglucose 6-dehydrogenase